MYSSVLHVPCSRAKHVKKRRHSRFWDDIVPEAEEAKKKQGG